MNEKNKSIMSEFSEIEKQTEELKELINQVIIPNKVWLPSVGIVTLYETRKNNV